MSKSLTDTDKRELANMIAPHLAWDLTGTDMYSWRHSSTDSAASVMMFISQIETMIRCRIHEGKSFKVAIIPQDGR